MGIKDGVIVGPVVLVGLHVGTKEDFTLGVELGGLNVPHVWLITVVPV